MKDERNRLEGMTQSYNVDDSLMMKDSKELKEILENQKNTYSLQGEADGGLGNAGGIKKLDE
jgi:hypothetical protein